MDHFHPQVMDISLVKSITLLEDYIEKNNIKYVKKKSTLCADDGEMKTICESDDNDTDNTIWKGPSVESNYIDLDYEKNDFEEMFHDPEVQTRPEPLVHQSPDLSQTAANADLRNKLSGSGQQKPPIESLKWRPIQPNLNTQRSAVIPPLMPTDLAVSTIAMFYKNNATKKNKNNYNKKNINTNNKKRSRKRNGGWNNNKNNNYYDVPQVNNNGLLSYAERNKREVLNQSLTNILKRVQRDVYPQDITVECENNCSRNPQKRASQMEQRTDNSSRPAGVVLNLENNGTNHTEQSSDSLSGVCRSNSIVDVLGIANIPHALVAAKMLAFLENSGSQTTVHKPIYDRRIQKDIHYLQKKPMAYKSPGGEIVSSDGIGIPNINIKPCTTGISLNHRFS